MIQKADVDDLPTESGVYIFSKAGKPIYIGKSVNIKTRVLSHIRQASLSQKEDAIVSQADNVKAIVTLSNFDAILLEAELIKRHRPKYNVVWKDDKNYLYIKITVGDTYPKIFPVRNENDGKSKYFGPFASSRMTHSLIYELRRITPFCTNRKLGKKTCFYSKIGLCNPCPNKIEQLEKEEKEIARKKYKKNIKRAIDLLSGKSNRILTDLQSKLDSYVAEAEFEDAIIIRDKLLNFTSFLERRSFKKDNLSREVDPGEVYKEFAGFMDEHFNYKLTKSSFRIECYDISNLQGKNATGSMVVALDGFPSKKHYKKFSVKRKGISDIHMMREVIERRLNHPEWGRPDLIVLDGGKPQLKMIYDYFLDNDINIPLISIAKRPDRIVIPHNNFKPISLQKKQLLYRLLQALRDESHRFAKKYHVMLRNRNRLN